MKRKDLYYTIQDKYSDEKGIVKGSPASVLFRLGHGVTQEQWESELTQEDIAFFCEEPTFLLIDFERRICYEH